MVIPAQYPFPIYKGDTFDLSLNWKDENGVLYDLRAFSAKLTFYDASLDSEIKTLTSAPGGGITLSNTEFNIVAKMTAAQTAELAFDSAQMCDARLEITSPDGLQTDRLLEGKVTLHD